MDQDKIRDSIEDSIHGARERLRISMGNGSFSVEQRVHVMAIIEESVKLGKLFSMRDANNSLETIMFMPAFRT